MKKKLLLTMLISAVVFSTFGCGKSEAVTNVENMIAELDNDDIESITNIESAYNALSDKDKEKVEGYDVVLSTKKALVEKRNTYAGEWERLSVSSYLYRDDCQTISFDADDTTWSLKDDTIFTGNVEYTVCEEYGITVLKNEKDFIYAKAEDADKVYNDAFLAVEITKDNWNDYLEFVYVETPIDKWGETLDTPWHIISSKMYDQGYVVAETLNCAAEYGAEAFGEILPRLGCGGTIGFNSYVETSKFPVVMNAKGTIIYVKKDYVTNYELTKEYRKVAIFDGYINETSSSDGYNPDFPW